MRHSTGWAFNLDQLLSPAVPEMGARPSLDPPAAAPYSCQHAKRPLDRFIPLLRMAGFWIQRQTDRSYLSLAL